MLIWSEHRSFFATLVLRLAELVLRVEVVDVVALVLHLLHEILGVHYS